MVSNGKFFVIEEAALNSTDNRNESLLRTRERQLNDPGSVQPETEMANSKFTITSDTHAHLACLLFASLGRKKVYHCLPAFKLLKFVFNLFSD